MPKKCLFRLELKAYMDLMTLVHFLAKNSAKKKVFGKMFLKNWIFDTLFGLKKHPCQIFIYYAKKVFVSVGIESLYGFNDFSALSCQKFGQKKSFWKIEFLTRYLA